MAPKHQKTAAEKRATRGPNSVWSRYGSMKAARTDRWYKWTHPPSPKPMQEFIAAHNIPSAHCEKVNPEGMVEASNQGALGSCFSHGQSSSSSDQPREPFCDAIPPQPAVFHIDLNQAPVTGACLLDPIKPIVVPQRPSSLPTDSDDRRASMPPPSAGECSPLRP